MKVSLDSEWGGLGKEASSSGLDLCGKVVRGQYGGSESRARRIMEGRPLQGPYTAGRLGGCGQTRYIHGPNCQTGAQRGSKLHRRSVQRHRPDRPALQQSKTWSRYGTSHTQETFHTRTLQMQLWLTRVGSHFKLRRFAEKLLRGEKVTVSVIGGSSELHSSLPLPIVPWTRQRPKVPQGTAWAFRSLA